MTEDRDMGYYDDLDAAERDGERNILREVAKLPSPWGMPKRVTGIECAWCHIVVSAEHPPIVHPDNGCLWPRALNAIRNERSNHDGKYETY